MCGGAGAADARLERVPQEIAERLAQQHLVAFDDAELAAHLDVAAERARVGPDFFRRPLADAAQIHVGQRQLRRPRELQEIGHHLAE